MSAFIYLVLNKIRHFYRKFENFFLVVLMLSSTAIVCFSVFMRYVLNRPLAWSEEIVCYLQVWIAFIGFSYIARNPDDFIRFDFIIHTLKPKTRTVLTLIERILLLTFMCILMFASMSWLIRVHNFGGLSTPMKIPNYIPRIVIPVSFLLLVLHYMELSIKQIVYCKNSASNRDYKEHE